MTQRTEMLVRGHYLRFALQYITISWLAYAVRSPTAAFQRVEDDLSSYQFTRTGADYTASPS